MVTIGAGYPICVHSPAARVRHYKEALTADQFRLKRGCVVAFPEIVAPFTRRLTSRLKFCRWLEAFVVKSPTVDPGRNALAHPASQRRPAHIGPRKNLHGDVIKCCFASGFPAAKTETDFVAGSSPMYILEKRHADRTYRIGVGQSCPK